MCAATELAWISRERVFLKTYFSKFDLLAFFGIDRLKSAISKILCVSQCARQQQILEPATSYILNRTEYEEVVFLAEDEAGRRTLTDQEHKSLLKEYELSQEMHNFYANQLWQIASILIGGSITGLAILISSQPRPSTIISGFALPITFMAFILLLTARRFKAITFAHLVRCREIEARLEMKQHIYVDRAGCRQIIVRRQDGEEETIGKIPSPTGYTLTQILCCILMATTLWIAIWYFPWLLN